MTPSAQTPPALSAAAQEISRVGAGEFVRYYLEVLDYAYTTGDVEPLAEISAAECMGCQRSIEIARETHSAGNHWEIGETTLHGVETATIDPTDLAEVFVLYSAEPSIKVAPDGTVISTLPSEENARLQFILENANRDGWIIKYIVNLEDGS